MKLRELADAFQQFNPKGPLTVSIPRLGAPPESRSVLSIGHLDHPGEVKTDVGVHMIDIVCGSWDSPGRTTTPALATVQDLLDALKAFPDEMAVRVALPISSPTHSHRMLDVYSVGILVGAPAGGIQIVTENIDGLGYVLKPHPEHAREVEAERDVAQQAQE